MEWAAPNRVVRKGLCDTETLSRLAGSREAECRHSYRKMIPGQGKSRYKGGTSEYGAE